MYENTTLKIRIGSSLSESIKYKRGVRQGCPTSPLLFNIYYNSVLEEINPVEVEGLNQGLRGLMFADDTVLLAESREDLVKKIAKVKNWMTENAMEINPTKCGIMEINTDAYCPQMEPLSYDDEIIPVVKKYVYLGIEINSNLDLTEMSRYRLKQGLITLSSVKNTLLNSRVPLEYRNMLIKNILIPRLMFGSEIFGMSEQRVSPLKRVLDNALKCVLKKSNFCRHRAYVEFDIKSLYIQAAVNRTRAIYKWKNARSLISSLIDSYENFKSRKRTWIKEANRWLRVLKIPKDLSLNEAINAVLTNRISHSNVRDKSVIGQFASTYNITSGKKIRHSELYLHLYYIGVNALTKIRTGTFKYTNDYVRTGKLPSDLHQHCMCCMQPIKEDALHLLTECKAFEEARKKFLASKKQSSVATASVQIRSLGALLGGEQVASHKKLPRTVLDVFKFLSFVVPRRLAILASYRVPLLAE